MIISVVLLLVSTFLLYLFYRTRKEKMTVFKKMGVPGPEPNFLFGNLLEFRKTALYRKHQEWRQEFGETFGYFEGPTPVLVTSDVNLLQEVFVKQFNKFHARKLWPVQVDPDKDEDVHMFFARGRRWKRLRHVVNPAFSAVKIRKMAPTVNDCINHLLDVIRDSSNAATNKTIELLNLFRRLTLDTILRCEVGLDQNSVKDPDDLFLKHCKGVIEDTTKMPWLYLLGFLFPNLHCVWITIYKFLHNIKFNPVFWLEDRMREVVVMRRNMKDAKRADLMQQMLNAQFSEDSFRDLENEESNADSPYKKTSNSMTNEEIVSHALLFLLAGYETTSTTLAYIFYELSQNHQVQQRLRHEVMTVLPRGYHQIGYDDLKKLTYLDYVIWETLRKYPLASTVTARQCMTECAIGDLVIPEGMLVHANLWDVQYDPKHWGDDPEKFDPLRFMPEQRKKRHPNAWMPFGGGPRSCAGLRFALLQLKMVVAKVLRDFDFHPSEEQSFPLCLVQGATILPADGVRLAAIRRGSAMSEAGLRRGSAMAGVSLSDWIKMRRTSIQEDRDTDDTSGLREDNEECRQRSKAGSVSEGVILDRELRPRSHSRRRQSSTSSTLEHELTENGEAAIRRASIQQGIELLTVDSTNKGFTVLRRVSFSETLLKSDSDNSEEEQEESQASDLISDANTLDANIPVSQMPEDIPGEMPRLLSRHVTRRRSALPELEAVREAIALNEFKPRWSTHYSSDTAELDTDEYIMKGTVPKGNRLYQRRGSG